MMRGACVGRRLERNVRVGRRMAFAAHLMSFVSSELLRGTAKDSLVAAYVGAIRHFPPGSLPTLSLFSGRQEQGFTSP